MGSPADQEASVADLLQNLNLTTEEGDMVEFSDDEDTGETPAVEWALVGKVLSPVTVHSMTIYRAMKLA